MSEQSHALSKGIHIVVATPGRLIDMLEKRRFKLDSCKYLCMDEADRMIDLGFEDDVRNIMSFFKVWVFVLSLLCDLAHTYCTAAKANVALLRYDATEDPRLRAAVVGEAGPCECWTCRCSQSGRPAGGGVRQAGGQDGLPPGVSAEDSSTGHHLQREQERSRRSVDFSRSLTVAALTASQTSKSICC